MVKFLLGDMGHGKSTYIVNQIKKDAENIKFLKFCMLV